MDHLQEQNTKLLRQSESLNALSDDALCWIYKRGKIVSVPKGELMFRKGEQTDEMRVLLKGRVSIILEINGREQEMGMLMPGDITGMLPYSRMKENRGYGKALEDSLILDLHKDHFPEMIRDRQDMVEVLVHHMMNRVKSFTGIERQNEKMMALGKLSAGLAHELNNPAAAIIRSAEALKKHLGHTPGNFKAVIKIKTDDKAVDFINNLISEKITNRENLSLSLLERTEIEEGITDLLDEYGMEDTAEDIAEAFTEYGFREEDVEEIGENVRPEDLPPVLRWIENNLRTESLVREIGEASERISSLVGSVKSYTHMDRAPVKCKSDLRTGIKNTLTILGHKIKKENVNVSLNFPDDFPEVPVFESEMNQVWTNLFDNAVDAMETVDKRELVIDAFEEDGFAKIEVLDSGPGVPDDIKDRIFDPFFTTKEVGKGSGMGLETVLNIMQHHNGRITLLEKDGRTAFQICLPIY